MLTVPTVVTPPCHVSVNLTRTWIGLILNEEEVILTFFFFFF